MIAAWYMSSKPCTPFPWEDDVLQGKVYHVVRTTTLK